MNVSKKLGTVQEPAVNLGLGRGARTTQQSADTHCGYNDSTPALLRRDTVLKEWQERVGSSDDVCWGKETAPPEGRTNDLDVVAKGVVKTKTCERSLNLAEKKIGKLIAC